MWLTVYLLIMLRIELEGTVVCAMEEWTEILQTAPRWGADPHGRPCRVLSVPGRISRR